MLSTAIVNKNFRIVFQPKQAELFGNKRRFAVGAGSLAKYIGQENANKAIQRAFVSPLDKAQVKLRKFGRIDFYSK